MMADRITIDDIQRIVQRAIDEDWVDIEEDIVSEDSDDDIEFNRSNGLTPERILKFLKVNY